MGRQAKHRPEGRQVAIHVNHETYVTIFLSPAELGQLRVELQECDVDWRQYPAMDRLTDCIIHGSDGEV